MTNEEQFIAPAEVQAEQTEQTTNQDISASVGEASAQAESTGALITPPNPDNASVGEASIPPELPNPPVGSPNTPVETTEEIIDKVNHRGGHYVLVLKDIGEDEQEIFAVHDSTPEHLHELSNIFSTIRRMYQAATTTEGYFQVGPHLYFKGTKQQVHDLVAQF